MSNIRNWYVYLTTAISLHGFTWALIVMLRNLVASGPISTDLEFLAFQIAVIIIGVPIFVIHWLWAQRLATASKEEQLSPLRRFYLYATLAAVLTPVLANTFDLFAYRLDGFQGSDLLHYLVTVIPLGVLFYYHQSVLEADTRDATPSGLNASIRRVYNFGFSAAGLWMVTAAIINLLYWLFLHTPTASIVSPGFSNEISPEVTRLLLGTSIWVFFWRWVQAAFVGPRADEKQSVLRKGYLYLVVFITSLSAVGAASSILAGYFRRVLKVSSSGVGEGPELGYAIIISMGIMWAYHAYVLKGDAAAAPDSLRGASVRNIYLYLVAGVGLAAFLSGLVGNVMVLIDNLTTSGAFGSFAKEQVSWATSAIIAGLPVWILPWRAVQLEALKDDNALAASNRRSTVRKAYLYFYLFLAVMSVLGGLIAIVYQILLLLLGERSGVGLVNDLAQAFSFTLIGAGVLGYHGKVLRSDGSLDAKEQAQRLQDFNVVLIDKGDGQFGLAMKQALSAQFPHLNLTPIGLTQSAAEALEMTAKKKDIPKNIASADLIVGPWDISVDDGSASAITKAVISSPAVKVLAPLRTEGWKWAGVDAWNTEDLVEQTTKAVKQVLEGEEVKFARSLGLGAIAIIVIGVLCLLSFVLSFVGEFLL